ncbi:MAG TPA: hypothetical protein DCY18_08545 [Thauera sp.]|jgi:hypothetical protein|nr:hypothetical protein [Thauera sp.]
MKELDAGYARIDVKKGRKKLSARAVAGPVRVLLVGTIDRDPRGHCEDDVSIDFLVNVEGCWEIEEAKA